MDIKNLAGTLASVKAENRLLKFAVVVIAASNLLFGFLAYTATKYKQVVVVPLTSSRVLVGKNPDPAYVMQVSRFVFDNLLTYTPWTVKKQYELVLQLFDPSVYRQYRKIFENFVKTASESKLSSVFIPAKFLHCPEKQVIKAEGVKLTLLEDEVVEKKFVVYELKYRVKYGTFRILSFRRVKEERR